MAVADPEAWVRNVERLYQAHDVVGVTALYAPEARTKFGSRVLAPREVHDHPAEWSASLDDSDDGLIYHKHACEVVEGCRDDGLDAAREACQVHQGMSS
jgi:hypothetical protein